MVDVWNFATAPTEARSGEIWRDESYYLLILLTQIHLSIPDVFFFNIFGCWYCYSKSTSKSTCQSLILFGLPLSKLRRTTWDSMGRRRGSSVLGDVALLGNPPTTWRCSCGYSGRTWGVTINWDATLHAANAMSETHLVGLWGWFQCPNNGDIGDGLQAGLPHLTSCWILSIVLHKGSWFQGKNSITMYNSIIIPIRKCKNLGE